jgi:hypothetical protein
MDQLLRKEFYDSHDLSGSPFNDFFHSIDRRQEPDVSEPQRWPAQCLRTLFSSLCHVTRLAILRPQELAKTKQGGQDFLLLGMAIFISS